MTLDELSHAIKAVSADPVVQSLAAMLLNWKTDDTDAEELRENVERFLGNTWVDGAADHEKIYRLWSEFQRDSIDCLNGMTMNERLQMFGLDARFDASQDDAEKRAVYRKLHAEP